MPLTLHLGDALSHLRNLPDESVQCCVTSPPYFGLRDYGHKGQVGLEPTPQLYVAALTEVFEEVRRVLKKDGVCWLNLGSSYSAYGRGGGGGSVQDKDVGTKVSSANQRRAPVSGFKPKELIGIPWMVAMALQAQGWYLRAEIIWAKGVSFCPNYSGSVMPESVKDRPTRGHEQLFLLTKNQNYFYDYDAVLEDAIYAKGTKAAKGSGTREGNRRGNAKNSKAEKNAQQRRGVENTNAARDAGAPHAVGLAARVVTDEDGHAVYDGKRNLRSVWCINTRPFKGAHFATFPPDLIRPCILAGSRPGDTVLDPFAGSGTTAQVALELDRNALLIELNPEYEPLIRQRTAPQINGFSI